MKDISRNLTMLFDYYELTMGNGYFQNGIKDKIAYFDAFFRRLAQTALPTAKYAPKMANL